MALSLRLLPTALREPLGLSYLLARASDTIADRGDLATRQRIQWLEAMAAGGYPGRVEECDQLGFNLAERDLLRSLPGLLLLLEQSPDRGEIRGLWQQILGGQLFDLRRFVSGCAPLERAELVDYCDRVAGCVGRSWTRLIERHQPRELRPPVEELLPLATGYGNGLQLLNILRDRESDRASGRPYIREEEVGELLALAVNWLDSGEQYLAAIRPGRILMASALPLDLARETLDLIGGRSGPQARLTRRDVRRILVRSLRSLVLPRRHDPV